MAEYALSAAVVSDFARRKCSCDEHDAYPFWAELLDRVGPAFPFIIRKECLQGIPYGDLGLPDIGRGELVAQPGEMWVLFCFRKALQDSFHPEAAIREAGFPLILEWRKDSQDSPLLSGSFHKLADLVRNQQKASGWGLHPAYGRYGDKVEFTDPLLFSDQEDLAQVSSSYGALSAGLYCAVHEKHPPEWTFPSLQWDEGAKGISGVAGIEEKIFVAAEYGAKYITVAATQKKEAESILRRLKTTNPQRFRGLSVVGTRSRGSLEGLAKAIAFEPSGRKRFVKYVAIGLGFVVAMVGAFVFDSTRSLSRYYAAYVDHYGLPEGLYEIPAKQVPNRVQSFRFDYSGVHWGNAGHSVHRRWQPKSWFGMPRKLVRMVSVNSRNVPTGVIRDDLAGVEMPPILEFDYSLNLGNVSKVLCRKRGGGDFVSGAIVKTIEFNDWGKKGVNSLVKTEQFADPDKYYAPKQVTCEGPGGDAVWGERSRICEYMLVRDEFGRVKRKFFADSQGDGALDSDGVGGLEYEYSDDGLIRQTRFLGKYNKKEDTTKIEYVMDGSGVSIRRFQHKNGDQTELSHYNASTNLVLGEHGAAIESVELDEFGNVRRLRLLDEKRSPINPQNNCGAGLGFAEVEMVISNGFHVVQDYRMVNEHGKVVTVNVMKTSFDDIGDPIMRSWYDAGNTPMPGSRGCPCERLQNDRELGLPTRIRFCGNDGKTPFYVRNNGVMAAGWNIRYDSEGNEVETCYVDGDGHPIRNAGNWVYKRCAYENAKLVEESYYDEATNFVSCDAGYACAKLHYEHGNLYSMWLFKNDGNGGLVPAGNQWGVHGYEWRYDDRGRRVFESYAYVNEEVRKKKTSECYGKNAVYETLPRGYRYGFSGRVLADGGEMEKIICVGKDLKTSVRAASGYAEMRSIYDHRHRLVFESTHDEQGNVSPRSGHSVAAYEYSYDQLGRQREMTCWNMKGERCTDDMQIGINSPAHRRIMEYYPSGLVKLRRYFGIDGKPVLQNNYHMERFVYDAKGREIETSYWGCKDEPVKCNQGYHVKSNSYTDRNELEETAYYGLGGTTNPVECVGIGAWKVRQSFDGKGNLVMILRYGADGELLAESSRAAYCKMSYDALNRLSEIRFFSKYDIPTVNDFNVARIAREYNGHSMQDYVRFCADEASEIGPWFLPGVAELVLGMDSGFIVVVDTIFKNEEEVAEGTVSIIEEILPKSVADRSGLKVGDVILSVNEHSDVYDCDYAKLLPKMRDEKKRLSVARWSPVGYYELHFDFKVGALGVVCLSGVKITRQTYDELNRIREHRNSR